MGRGIEDDLGQRSSRVTTSKFGREKGLKLTCNAQTGQVTVRFR